MDDLNKLLKLAGVKPSNVEKEKLDEGIIGGMQEVRHVSQAHMNENNYKSEEELHDLEVLSDDIESQSMGVEITPMMGKLIRKGYEMIDHGMDPEQVMHSLDLDIMLDDDSQADALHRMFVKYSTDSEEYGDSGDLDAYGNSHFDHYSDDGDEESELNFESQEQNQYNEESEMSDLEKERALRKQEMDAFKNPTSKDADEDVSDLISKIDDIQSMGISAVNRHYSTDKLLQLPSDAVKRIYAKVSGEGQLDEYVDHDEDESELPIEDVDAEGYFPKGAHNSVTKSTGTSAAKHGDNPMQKATRVSESAKDIHRDMVYQYRKFLGENKDK